VTSIVTDARIGQTIETAYDAATNPERWPLLLERLAQLFRSHFADLFARSHNRVHYRGLAFGLPQHEYEHEFLDTWSKRNVWGQTRPVRIAGEVLSTRAMVSKRELVRSEIYNEYLAPRGLHEGLRISIWSDDDGIQDISLLRPWSAGPFEGEELALAAHLLPHLQRAAAIARALRQATLTTAASLAHHDATGSALFTIDRAGRATPSNRAAETLVQSQQALALRRSQLHAATPDATRCLHACIARAIAPVNPHASTVSLPRAGKPGMTLLVTPLNHAADWSLLHPPAALAIVTEPPPPPLSGFQTRFGLTKAEDEIATLLVAGRSAAEIAEHRKRSINTIRTQLSQLMDKMGAVRQGDLVRLLLGAGSTDP